MSHTNLRFRVPALVIILSACQSAYATLIPVVVNASNSVTVQPAGPVFNAVGFGVEGSSNAANSSFGVVDFSFSGITTFPGTPTNIAGATLNLVELNTTSTAPGPISIYLSPATGVSIALSNTSLNYVSGSNGLASVDTDLGPLTLLGSGTFNTTGKTGSGTEDLYSLTFSGSALTTLLNTLQSKGILRLVVTPDAATTAATWAVGGGGPTLLAPSLGFFAVVPEPASLPLLALRRTAPDWLQADLFRAADRPVTPRQRSLKTPPSAAEQYAKYA